jgi:excisionase family DNA binding protein
MENMDSIERKLKRIVELGIKYHPDNFESLKKTIVESTDPALCGLWFDICEQWLEAAYVKIAKTEQRSEVDSTWRSHWEEAFKAKKNLEQEIERLRTEFGFKKMRHTSGTGLTERKRQPGPSGGSTDQMLTATQAAEFLGITKSYLYKLSSKGILAKHKPGGKIILFARTDLEGYRSGNRIPSVSELAAQTRSTRR